MVRKALTVGGRVDGPSKRPSTVHHQASTTPHRLWLIQRLVKLPRPVHHTWAEQPQFVQLTGDEYALRSWSES